MWIAHMEPYTGEQLGELLKLRHRDLRVGAAGKTLGGREIPLLTITDAGVPEAGKMVVWLMARQHAWEAGTSWVADGAVRFLLSGDAEAARIRRTTVFQVMPLFDIDGAGAGAVRFNGRGYDNNRNWDTAEPESMAEIFSVRQTLKQWVDGGRKIDAFLAMHNTESADYVEGPVTDARVRPVADALVAGLRETTSFVDERSPRDSMRAPIDKGRYTVNQYLYGSLQLPAFLMELMVERHPRLGRPRAAKDFAEMGPGLVKSLARAAETYGK
jgi:hypothetical protein